MNRVLVTGAAGFIGSNFVIKSLRERPDLNFVVLDALTYAGQQENLSSVLAGIEFIHGNICNPALVNELVKRSDLVVHFAAESHNDNSLKNPGLFVETNITGTYNLIQAAAKHQVRYHHISTDEVYGDLPLDSAERFTEDSVYRPSSPYSASKAASDLLVRAWVRSFDLAATISNCSNNFGPNQHLEKFIPNTINHLIQGRKPPVYGTGLNIRDWIHVDDHIAGVWAAIENGKIGETYLLGANCERSNLQVVQALLKIFDLSDDYFDFVPDRKGHDLRYAINPAKANQELAWSARRVDFEKELTELVDIYKAKLI